MDLSALLRRTLIMDKRVKTMNGVKWWPQRARVNREMKEATIPEVYIREIAHDRRTLLQRITFISFLQRRVCKEDVWDFHAGYRRRNRYLMCTTGYHVLWLRLILLSLWFTSTQSKFFVRRCFKLVLILTPLQVSWHRQWKENYSLTTV